MEEPETISPIAKETSKVIAAEIFDKSLNDGSLRSFNENPSWLLEDIMDLKLKSDPINRRRPKDLAQLRKSDRNVKLSSVIGTAMNPADLPDSLANAKTEWARGRTQQLTFEQKSRAAVMSFSGGPVVQRDTFIEEKLRQMQEEELRRKEKKNQMVQSQSNSLMPAPSLKYLDRLATRRASPPRGTSSFTVHSTVPRPSTAPSRGRPRERDAVDALIVSKGDDALMPRSPSRSPERAPGEDSLAALKSKRSVLVSLIGWWYAKNLKSRLAVVQYYDELRDHSIRILQRFLKKKMRKIRSARSAGAIPMILKKVLVRHWRKKSIEKVKFFLAESAKNQKSKIIRRFIYRVKKLQIKIKKWVETNNARREVLLRYWDHIERSYRKRLSDENAAAIQARIEQEKRLKKRHRPLIQEQWNKTKENVGKLLKKATRVQNKYSREKASQMGAEPSIHSMGSVLYGEFDGKIPESERLRVINETVSLKRKLHMLRQRQEKDMATKNIQAK